MKIKPILFSTEMVNAILSGNKTQTRRIVKKQPMEHHWQIFDHYKINTPLLKTTEGTGVQFSHSINGNRETDVFSLAKASINDVFWVRETFVKINIDHEFKASEMEFAYRASFKDAEKKYGNIKNPLGKRFIDSWKWKPSIFMPKAACRIFLKVVNVRIERLKKIDWKDIQSEGLHTDYSGIDGIQDLETKWGNLWTKINGKESWEENPFVWVYDFKIIEKPNSFNCN